MSEFSRDVAFLLSFLDGRKDGLIALDVGAHHGKFTQALLDSNHFEKIHAFEPNPLVLAKLQSELVDPRVNIHALALAELEGEVMLWCDSDSATGSLLPYHPTYDRKGEVSGTAVSSATLNEWSRMQGLQRLDLLKVDSQGNDHRVLSGGADTIRRFRPVVMVELVFAPLYSGQGNLSEVLTHFDAWDYQLVRLRNIHENERGLISFVDAFFVPRELVTYEGSRFAQVDVDESLYSELVSLQQVCQERLECINRLDAELQLFRQTASSRSITGLKALISRIFNL